MCRPPAPVRSDDSELVARLRRGDERAFAEVVSSWSPMMLRVARGHVSTDASCEEIVQETWMAVVRGLDGFEGRSSLRTWVFRILTNLAKTRGVREARSVPMSSWGPADETGPTVDPDRFRSADDQYPHNWTPVGAPAAWQPGPEQSAVAAETRQLLGGALRELPDRQRTVVTLRDVHGLHLGRGLQPARPQRGQPAGLAASRPGQAAHRPGGLLPRARGGDVVTDTPHPA